MLKRWQETNNPLYEVMFLFRYGRFIEVVSITCDSRKHAAKILRTYRAARESVRRDYPSSLSSVVRSSKYELYSYRWLACRWCQVAVISWTGEVIGKDLMVPPAWRRRKPGGKQCFKPRSIFEFV